MKNRHTQKLWELEKENEFLRRNLKRTIQQQLVQEGVNDNLLSLLTRINEDYQRSLALIEKKNKDLENLTERLNLSYQLEMNANQQLRKEIAERKQAELDLQESKSRLRRSLEEKEVMLREIHHRVKNNLQVVSSLLQMSRNRSTDEKVKEALSESCSRVSTMALIHSQLYQTHLFSKIDMKLHSQQLFQNLSALYGHKDRICWGIDIHEVFLSVNQAIPLALVMNELLSNAFKHAFKGRESGRIHLAMSHDMNNGLFVEVRDNGNGLPHDMEAQKAETLGLKLVHNIVRDQLHGKLSFDHNGSDGGKGVRVRISFPTEIET